MTAARPLIVTLHFHAEDQARFDVLRRAHFPPALNQVPAHLTLFHALPGDEEALVLANLETVCARQSPATLDVTGLRSLGRGVAFALDPGPVGPFRLQLARAWHEWLTPQDRQGWRPHVTIQNKASAGEAAALMEAMRAGFAPFTVRAEGIDLWRYMGGPWELVRALPFGDASSTA